MAYFYLNVLTFTTTPAQLLQRLRSFCTEALATVLASIDQAEQHWSTGREGLIASDVHKHRSGVVLSYAELSTETVQRLGEERVRQELAEEWERWPANLDKRERCLHLVYRLWTPSGRQGPAVVVYYSPPYYPHVAATPSALHDAVAAVSVYGRGAHQRGERVLMSYSFGILPQLLYETIERLERMTF